MITVKSGENYELRWLNGQWRDKAGHIWEMDSKGDFRSKEHGFVPSGAWKIPNDSWGEVIT